MLLINNHHQANHENKNKMFTAGWEVWGLKQLQIQCNTKNKYAASGIKIFWSYKNCIYKVKKGMWKYINYILIVINNKVYYVNIKMGAV